jgi:ABC-type transport system involved in multi-copper enzyme maturation permease subunit
MLPGPVFNVELLTTARRARYYALRFLYGLVLLLLIWQHDPALYPGGLEPYSGELTIQEMALLGQGIFRTFAITQGLAVCFLTPAIVAGVISDEKQRKTLHDLLASRLTSGEIVLGKLAARLLHVGVFLTVGVPVMSLMSLFGGVAPESIVLVYAGTCTTVFFLAALSVLVSTYARRSRDAISLVYILELGWLFVPSLTTFLMPRGGWPWNRVYSAIEPVNNWVRWSSPIELLLNAARGSSSSAVFLDAFAWMAGLQLGYGTLFVLWSVARLRPVYRKSGEGGRWLSRVARGRRSGRLLPRPECGGDAMLWKERYVSRTGVATKVVGLLALLVLGGVVGYSTCVMAREAFVELREYGYGSSGANSARNDFNTYIKVIGTLTYVVWVLGVASAASSGVTSEREGDTWVSLTSTPLEGWEIIRAKLFGAVWGTRGLGLILLGLWGVGLACGAIHPFGLVALQVVTAVFLWFVTALGVYLSLRSKTSARAMTATVALLLLLNGGYLLCCIPLQPDTSLVLAGVTPYVEVVSCLTYGDLWNLFFLGESSGGRTGSRETALTCLASVLIYGAAALLLTVRASGAFDEEIDRPRRSLTTAAEAPPLKPDVGDGDEDGVAT